jgi:hypothetical protein
MVANKFPHSFIMMIMAIILLVLPSLACANSTPTNQVAQIDTSTPTNTITASPTIKLDPTVEPSRTSTRLPSATFTPSPLGNATITSPSCNLRAGPGTNFIIVGYAKSGEVYPVYGKDANNEWIALDKIGSVWISVSLVSLDVDIATITIKEPAAPEVLSTMQPPSTLITPTVRRTGTIPTPVFSNAQISVFNIFTDMSSTGMSVLGEVMNTGVRVLKNIRVTVNLYDSEGRLLDTDSANAYLPWEHNLWNTGVLYVSDKAPFVVIFTDPGNWDSYKVEVTYENADYEDHSDHYDDLLVLNDYGRDIDDFLYNYQVAGEIKNTGDYTCGSIWIILTLYNAKGEVIGIGESLTDIDRLPRGLTETFRVQAYAHDTVASYSLLLDAIQH